MFAEYYGPRCSQVTYSLKAGWDLLLLSSQNFVVSAKPLMDFALDKLHIVNICAEVEIWVGTLLMEQNLLINKYIFLPKLFELLVEVLESQLSYFKS